MYEKRILAAMLTLSMVVSMTACGNSEAGGSKDSAKNNGNGDEPYTVTMVLNGSTQPDEERIEQKSMRFLNRNLMRILILLCCRGQVQASSYSLCYQGMKKLMSFIPRQPMQCSI